MLDHVLLFPYTANWKSFVTFLRKYLFAPGKKNFFLILSRSEVFVSPFKDYNVMFYQWQDQYRQKCKRKNTKRFLLFWFQGHKVLVGWINISERFCIFCSHESSNYKVLVTIPNTTWYFSLCTYQYRVAVTSTYWVRTQIPHYYFTTPFLLFRT